ncbi:NADPH-dependent glutamate synthase beta chain [Rubellimicrobium thermophilum DSM 16684]|uniref:NADPH-dependent glutamate synthase beta chain n=1 Tax=Rubellimicrobium thermophilum DSM 16684 TaxID=1123069 RepID=S9RZ02_9RHOB|nr:NAD(P)-dependent oxidoreductase [Rubellimicrobium thermophilum]EPX83250.1 NADPH-dependent glutamate synthase beta chain [Rubellimicrobium thermophilum DSM 16684]
MNSPQTPGVVPHRLDPERIASNFADIAPPLTGHEAKVAADRCYFCYDAPCIQACPTAIDIPLFIRQIQAGRPVEAAMTIWSQNIFGGACARVCPTEQLCEGACVREAAEGKPVEIGRLQRFATDAGMARNSHPFTRAPSTGKRVAVVGAGPAGLACAHRLAMHGHDVVVFEKRAKPGGLNEYGIAAYKVPGGFAQEEVSWLLGIGGIEIRCGVEMGRDVTLDQLRAEFDAVFLGIGLQDTNDLRIPGEDRAGVEDAVDFIERLRQAPDKGALPVGRSVVVIGGGMTAVDAAVQSRALGAETVTIVYRRGQEQMSASRHEQEHAATAGVRIIHEAAPVEIRGNGAVTEVQFAYTESGPEGLRLREEGFRLEADQVFKAIGQRLGPLPEGVATAGGKIDPARLPAGVWAGGDCAPGGQDLTVTAVAQGRDAAEAIHRALMG